MKKICVISGTRADYGLLYWIMKNIQSDNELELQTIVTSMHLNPKFGDTWKNFEKDGLPITLKVDLGEQLDSTESVVNQVSIGVNKFFKAYQVLNPDLVVILGDRYEMLAAAQASVFAKIPIAHIHGGEITQGAFDDVIRHSITKMSTYHFTATEEYKKRVIQMGEHPERVNNIGAVGLENIKMLNLLKKEDMPDIPFKDRNFLVTYHPVTAANEDATEDLLELLSNYKDACHILTMPNSDPGHNKIYSRLQKYAKDNENVYLTPSLGFLRYLSCMKICDVVIGNSSSGIIEAPFLGTPTLNIGVRQKGRLSAKSVIDASPDELQEKLQVALNESYKISTLYGDGDSSVKFIDYIKKQNLKNKVGFYDI